MVKINLLPLSIRKTKAVMKYYAYGVMGGIGLLAMLLLLLLSLAVQNRHLDARLASMRAENATLARRVGPFMDLEAQAGDLERVSALYARLQGQQRLWIKILDELADRVQDDMWLTRLASQPAKDGGVSLKLEGEAYHQMPVAEFLKALESSATMRNPALASLIEQKNGDAGPSIRFNIRAEYRPDGAANAGGRP